MTGLAARVRECSARALARGALEPVATVVEAVEEVGLHFSVRVVDALRRKPGAPGGARSGAPGANPFLPWDPDLLVAELSATHVALLNKYPAIDGHLLVVTRTFEDQEELLGPADFEALALLMEELDGLAFYNAGAVAGASQRHRHLQLVPLRAPLDDVLAAAVGAGLERAAALPWPHRVGPTGGVAGAEPRYRALLASLGLDAPGRPYNLLLTRRWICAVPRARESFAADGLRIGVNALGFAGALLARDADELACIRAHGPVAVLRAVAGRAGSARARPG